jgi:pyruvate,water dikinase
MIKKNILWFKEINKTQIPDVGGKGANLGEMINNKFPIPNGFVVTSYAYAQNAIENKILKKIEDIEKNIDVNKIPELNKKSKQIKEIILKSKISKQLEKEILEAYKKLGKCLVAVRSSATAEDLPGASFAGQQDTFLNILGEKSVLEHVKKCWASLFNPRAIFYRRKQGFPIDKVKLAVVVQKQVNSEISGIMFTANPITNNTREIVIESVYGLGEAIVSGSVTPDTIIIDKKTMKVKSKTISKQSWKLIRDMKGTTKKENVSKNLEDKQKLSDKIILDFAKIGYNIEKHYKVPQDIEWAMEKNVLYIVQSRPITTLKAGETKTQDKISGKIILEGLGASSGVSSGQVKIVKKMSELNKIKQGDVLVTKMTTPDMVPQMKKASGIITDEGGITCHAAIVSRELGIPAIVGTEKATQILKENQIVTIDANKGKVYDGKVSSSEKIEIKETKKIDDLNFITKTKVKVNLAFSDAAEKAAKTNPDGIGLMRAEHLLTASREHPYHMVHKGKTKELQKLLETELEKIMKHFKNKPVYYRTFDARTDEYVNLKGGDKEPKEDNPMLGWHGIRRDLDEPEMLKTQFKAIKNVIKKGYTNIGVMIPFTQNVKEYLEAKKIAESVNLRPHKDCFFGIMVETPGCALTIEEYIAAKIDFVSFGTNDLTQLTLGLDRNNDKIQKWFSEMHPSILKQIAHVISYCKPAKVRTSICGQAGSNPEMVKELVKIGIDSISANIDAVDKIKETVYNTEKEMILEALKTTNLKKRAKL